MISECVYIYTFIFMYLIIDILMPNKQKKNVTKPLIDMMDEFIKVNEFSLDINQLLAYLLCRQNAGNEFREDIKSFSDIEAVSFIHSLVLSKEQTRRVRQFLTNKQIINNLRLAVFEFQNLQKLDQKKLLRKKIVLGRL